MWYTCENCGKTLSSYHSLWRHKKKCQPKKVFKYQNQAFNHFKDAGDVPHSIVGQKRQVTYSPPTVISHHNPKIQALANEIINDSSRRTGSSRDLAAKPVLPPVSTHPPPLENPLAAPTADALPLATPGIAAEVFKIPRTKADIMGYDDGDEDDDDTDADNDTEEEDDDDEDDDDDE